MATRRVSRAGDPGPEQGPTPGVVDALTETDIFLSAEPRDVDTDDLQRVLGELGARAGGIIKIERRRPDKQIEFVDETPVDVFSLKSLQEHHGGGDYLLTGLDEQRRFVFRRRSVVVAAPPRRDTATPAEGAIDKLAKAVQASLDQQQRMIAMLMLQGRQVAPAPSADPGEMRRQLLQDLALMKQIAGGDSAPGVGIDKMMEVFKLGIETARESGGGEGGDWVTLATELVKQLGEPVAEVLKQRAVPSVPTAGAQRVTHTALPSATSAGANPMDMKKAVAQLVEKAASNADVGLYADLILDNVPASTLDLILQGDPVARLAQIDPRVNQHAEWFRDLGAMLREALSPDAAGPGSESDADLGNAGESAAGQ